MQYPIVIQFIGFIIFLFSVYTITRDDFLLLRKNVSVEQIYNVAFLTTFVSIFSARVFFVLFNFKPLYLQPLVFLVLPYYPGLDIFGLFIGGYLVIQSIAKTKKLPKARILDIFTVSFFYAITAVYFLGTIMLLVFRKNPVHELVIFVVCSIGVLLLRKITKKLQEGVASAVIIAILSVIFCVDAFLLTKSHTIFFLVREIVGISVFLTTVFVIVTNQMRKQKM